MSTPLVTPDSSAGTSSGQKNNKGLSPDMTTVLVFVVHSSVNAALLTPWNPLRCAYWNLAECSIDESWMLNWLALGSGHVCVLLATLAVTAHGSRLLEQRLLHLCCTIMLAFLTSGIFMLDYLNKPMAALQMLVYVTLLGATVYRTASISPLLAAANLTTLPSELRRSSSFDARRKLPIPTAIMVLQFALSTWRILDMTFGTGRDGYLGDMSGPIYHNMSHAATGQMLWVTLILGFGTFLAPAAPQQKRLLAAHALAMFASQALLAGSQGEMLHPSQRTAGGIATFVAIVTALVGAC